MAEKRKPRKTEAAEGNPSHNVRVGGNVDKSVVVTGDHNIVNYYATVEANTEKHEPEFWRLAHPYPMPPNFTGRVAERALLTHWLKEDSENRLFILRALGGKSLCLNGPNGPQASLRPYPRP